jgi:hypothetical protein
MPTKKERNLKNFPNFKNKKLNLGPQLKAANYDTSSGVLRDESRFQNFGRQIEHFQIFASHFVINVMAVP